tara:strand:- start:8451 stop:9236 length:786 start_codon:yes stop_codon:yes gene_type:complete
MENNSLLKVNSIFFKVRNKIILDDISISIKSGDMISIIGPNGSGKTTMLKAISNEIPITNGEVLFHNKNILNWDINSLANQKAVLSQSNNLVFPFSVIDIVKMGRFPIKDKGNQNEEEKLCKNILEIFDLGDYINQNYITLSGGEKQRVQLARVVAQIWSEDYSNKLLILDEPTSYLDIKHQYSLFNFLKKLNQKGLTIMMVLHDLNHAIANSNKIVVLKNSKLISYGETKEVITEKLINKVFEIDLKLINYDGKDTPIIF